MSPGEVVAQRFELLALAGAGASGTVWRARDRVGGETVALKVVELATVGLERFAREARVLATLQHPGIVRYVAHGSIDDYEAYLAMEWLEGESLATTLRQRKQLPLREAVDLVRRVARALGAAHRAGIVHRDVKPGNVFLAERRSDRPMLLDFGIAHVPDAINPTRTGATLGTAGYLSPEQVGRNAPVTARSDVFSLGCVLYECVTGIAPFATDSPIEALTKVLLEDPPPLAAHVPDASPALEQIVSEMLCKESEDRPSDAAVVAERLQAVLDDLAAAPPLSRPLPSSLTLRPKQLTTTVLLRGAATGDATSIQRSLQLALPGLEWRIDARGDPERLELSPPGLDPIERASNAARAALLLARQFERFSVALVTAHGAGAINGTPVVPPGAVALDEATAEILPSTFEHALRNGLRLLEARLVARVEHDPDHPRVPFVGRKRELSVLRVLAESAFEESYPGIALVIGEAGVGKTRLWKELLRDLGGAGHVFRVFICRSDPMRRNSPWSTVADGVRRFIGLQSDDDVSAARARLDTWVSKYYAGADLDRMRDFIGELVGVNRGEPVSPRLAAARKDPSLLSFEIERAFVELAKVEGGGTPLIAVVDDAQWADVSSLQLIDKTLGGSREAPLVVIATADESLSRRFPGLWQGHNPQVIRLEPLSARASRELATQLLPELPAERVEQVLERAEGNPLMLYELADASRERPSGELPLGVRALMEQRIAHFEPDAQQVLMAASVLGSVFWRGAIEKLVAEDVAQDLDGWLRILEQAEVIRRRPDSRLPAQIEYELSHRLMADVAYDMLPADARSAAHSAVVDWLELAGERDVAVIAQHAERAGERTRAAELWYRAAERALEAFDPKTCLALCERAVESGASGELLGRVRLVEASASEWSGNPEAAYQAARRAMALLPPRSARWYDASRSCVISAFRIDRVAELSPLLDELAAGLDAGDGAPAALAVATGALSMIIAANDEVGSRLLRRLEAHPEHERLPEVASRMAATRAIIARRRGDLLGYLHHNRITVDMLAAEPDARNACTRLNNHGAALRMLGRIEQARDVLQRAEASAEQVGAATIATSARFNLAFTELHARNLPRALELARRAAAESRAAKTPRMEALARILIARCLLEASEALGAETEARRAIEVASPESATHAFALTVLAAALHAQGRLEEADTVSSQSLALRGSSDSIEEGDALTPLVRAEILWSLNRHAEARAVLGSALARIEHTASRITDPAEHDAFVHGLIEHERIHDLQLRWNVVQSS